MLCWCGNFGMEGEQTSEAFELIRVFLALGLAISPNQNAARIRESVFYSFPNSETPGRMYLILFKGFLPGCLREYAS